MAITLNNYQIYASGSSYTVPGDATNNRLLIVVPFSNSTENREPNAVRVGGTPMTLLGSANSDTQADLGSGVFYLKESNIPAGSQIVDIDWLDTVGAGSGSITTNESRTAFIAFTAYDFDQNETPSITTSVVERSSGELGSQQLTITYPTNSGDFGIGICLASIEKAETHSIAADVGDLVGEGNATGLNGLFSTQSVFNKVVKIDSLSGSDQTIFTADYSNSGTVSGSLRSVRAYGLSIKEQGGTPLVSLTQSEITPGSAISGTYSNFTPGTPPTSPIIISDGTNNINVSVTINDNNDGTGTFSGTMPNLPSVGFTSSLLLFGNVTVTLDDA